MITQRLKNIFGLSIPLFIAHGLEEYWTGLYSVDSHVKFMFGFAQNMSSLQATFLIFQIMLWLTLIVSYVLMSSNKWAWRLMFIPGIVFIYELHHFYKAFMVGGYYPGLITALLFPVIGYMYWRELLKAK